LGLSLVFIIGVHLAHQGLTGNLGLSLVFIIGVHLAHQGLTGN